MKRKQFNPITIILIILIIVFILSACEKKTTEPVNNAPKIIEINVNPNTVGVGQTAILTGIATDEDDDNLIYSWFSEHGSFPQGTNGSSIQWKAPDSEGNYSVILTVSDNKVTSSADRNINVTILTGSIEGYVFEANSKINSYINHNNISNKKLLINNRQNFPNLTNKSTIEGVNVRIGQIETVTNSFGYFILENIPIGNQLIIAEKLGYINYSDSLNVIVGSLDYDIYLKHSTQVHGHTYYSGTTIPISGVLVSIDEFSYTTGSDGFFQLSNLNEGLNEITAVKMDYDNYSATINIPSDGLEHNIELTSILYVFNVFGQVENNIGEYVDNCVVTVLNPDSTLSDLWTTTDNNGYYILPSVPQGNRYLHFYHDNYEIFKPGIFLGGNHEFNTQLTALPISAPSNLSALINWQITNLSWDIINISTIDGYNLYRSLEANSGYTLINTNVISSDTDNYEITIDNQECYYKISSLNIDSLEGELSDFIQVTPQSSGIISENTNWSEDIYITSDVTLDENIILSISSGTTISFSEGGLFINGALNADGNEQDMILFSSSSLTSGSWSGIKFNDTANDENCILRYCTIEYAFKGIHCVNSSPIITNNYIRYNYQGIYCEGSNPSILSNRIYENSDFCHGYDFDSQGSGIYCSSSNPEIIDNMIYDNNTNASGNSTRLRSQGAGIYCFMSSPHIINNSIYNNNAYSAVNSNGHSDSQGGGIYIHGGNPLILNNLIYNNAVSAPRYLQGGGIYCYLSNAAIINNVVYNNSASEGGGIYGNSIIKNCIVWSNGDDLNSCLAEYSNIEDGDNGTGNISVDPQFIFPSTGDFHLQPNSPCIDAGDPDTQYNDPDGSRNDMGAYGGPNGDW